MRRHSHFIGMAIMALAVAGCGASSRTTTSAPSARSTSTPAASSSLTASATSASTTPGSAPSAGGKRHRSAQQTRSTASASASSAARAAAKAPDTNVRVPATFTIGPNDRLDPPLVAAPKNTDVRLTVRSGDGKAHAFVLRTPHQQRLSVSGGHSASVLLTGVPVGNYRIDIDGVRRGELIIGAAPGP